MRLALVSLALVSAVTRSPASADAKCAPPGTFVAPPPGSPLPPSPVIHAFDPWGAADPDGGPVIAVVDATGAAVEFSTERVTSSAAYDVHRIAIHRAQPGAITVRVGSAEATFTIDPAWSRPPGARLGITSTSYRRSQWTCSREDSLRLVPSIDAPVYRIDYEVRGVGDRGVRERAILYPRDPSRFWEHLGRDARDAPEIALGQLDCIGVNLDLVSARTLRVSAVFADGAVVQGNGDVHVLPLIALLRPAEPPPDPLDLPFAVERLLRSGVDDPAFPDPAWPYYALGVVAGLAAMALRARRRAARRGAGA